MKRNILYIAIGIHMPLTTFTVQLIQVILVQSAFSITAS